MRPLITSPMIAESRALPSAPLTTATPFGVHPKPYGWVTVDGAVTTGPREPSDAIASVYISA